MMPAVHLDHPGGCESDKAKSGGACDTPKVTHRLRILQLLTAVCRKDRIRKTSVSKVSNKFFQFFHTYRFLKNFSLSNFLFRSLNSKIKNTSLFPIKKQSLASLECPCRACVLKVWASPGHDQGVQEPSPGRG